MKIKHNIVTIKVMNHLKGTLLYWNLLFLSASRMIIVEMKIRLVEFKVTAFPNITYILHYIL